MAPLIPSELHASLLCHAGVTCLQMKALVEMEGSGLVPLLADDAYEDLGRMYSLFKRVEDGLPLLKLVMGNHIKEQGKTLVNDPEKVGKEHSGAAMYASLAVLSACLRQSDVVHKSRVKTCYCHVVKLSFLQLRLCCCGLVTAVCSYVLLQTKDPVEYVSALLEMRDKYENTISKAFSDDKSFRNTLNQVSHTICCAHGTNTASTWWLYADLHV